MNKLTFAEFCQALNKTSITDLNSRPLSEWKEDIRDYINSVLINFDIPD